MLQWTDNQDPKGLKLGLGRLWLLVGLIAFLGVLALCGGCSSNRSRSITGPPGQEGTPWVARYASHTEVVCSEGAACATYSVALELYEDWTCLYVIAIEAHPGTSWALFESEGCTYQVTEAPAVIVNAHGLLRSDGSPDGEPGHARPYFDAELDWSGLWLDVRLGEPPIFLERV